MQTEQHNIYKFKPVDFQQKLTFVCKFCGGATCKLQDYKTNSKPPNSINGLHSNWITDNILAMQRPSQRLIKQFNLYEQFKKNKIITILNLQQPGEHPYCGDGIIGNVGFSYIPENLFKHNIFFFNQSWEDMTATTDQYMMKIMNIFSHTFQQGGKIAVHCHAGRGRTLLAICSWLIFDNKFTAEQVIKLAIQKRQGVLSRNSQRQFLYEFQKFIKMRRISFGILQKISFQKVVSRQQEVLLKRIKSQCHSSPFVHYMILKQIYRRLDKKIITQEDICLAFTNFNNQIFDKWTQEKQKQIVQLKTLFNNNLAKLEDVKDIRILFQTLFDFYDQLPYNPLNVDQCQIMQQQKKKGKKCLQILTDPQLINRAGLHILCTILSWIQFVITLKRDPNVQKKIGWILNRIIKCLLSKKKFSKNCYQNRQLKLTIELNGHETCLKNYMYNLMKERQANESSLESLIMGIKKVAYDLYVNLQKMKRQKSNDIFSQKQMKQIYAKCIR